MTTNEWLTPAEAGAILGVGPDRVAQLVRQGLLPAMRTPGGHVRIRRDQVEKLANPSDEPPADELEKPEEDDAADDPPTKPSVPMRPRWENLPPWKRRVREAEADVKALEFDDQRERLLEARAERQAQREQAEAERDIAAGETERLRKLRSLALTLVPWGAPADVKAEVARQLEHAVTSGRYPASLAEEHANTLLRSDVERLLRPWRTREARREGAHEEARKREDIVGWAVLHATLKSPRAWDWDTKRAFERGARRVLEKEYEPGMDQDDADEIAFDVLDEWMEDDEEDA